MAIFSSYVSLPEGILTSQEERVCDGCFDLLQHDKGRPVNEQFLELKRIEARFRKIMERCNWDLWDLYGYMRVYIYWNDMYFGASFECIVIVYILFTACSNSI